MSFNHIGFKDCPFCGNEMVGFTRFNCNKCKLEWQYDSLERIEIAPFFWVDLPEGVLVVRFEVML